MDRILLFALFAGALVATSCHDHPQGRVVAGASDDEAIYINGASTVGHVIPDLVNAFRKEPGNANARIIYPEGEGSEGLTCALDSQAPRGTRVWDAWQGSTWGLKLLNSGDVDIGAMARRPSAAELEKARAGGSNPKLHVIAYDAVALVVHPAMAGKVNKVTRTQLRKLYLTGEAVSWTELGRNLPDRPVRAFGSNPEICGTALAFAEVVDPDIVKARKAAELFHVGVVFRELAEVMDAVLADEYSLGFIQFALLPNDPTVHIAPYLDDIDPSMANPVTPSNETCSNGMYPLQRPLVLLTSGTAEGLANRFVRFVLGPKGKAILAQRSCIVPR